VLTQNICTHLLAASGLSYWIYQGEKHHGINVQSLLEAYEAENKRKPSCTVVLSEQNDEPSEFTRISAENLIFPLLFFLGFAILAVILQLYHQWLMEKNKKKPTQDRKTSFGRSSSLDLFVSSKKALDEIRQEEEETRLLRSEAGNNFVASIATGAIFSDSVHLDESRDRTKKKKVTFSIDTDNDARSVGRDNVTLSQLDSGVLDKLDEFIACYQTIKRGKEPMGTK